MPESELEFDCPYCGETNSLRLDLTGGKRQVFVTDCGVCCRPIKVTAEIGAEDEVTLDVKQEDEE